MIDFGSIDVNQNRSVSFSLPWLGSQDPDAFGNRGWSRLPQPLLVEAREGYLYNSGLVATGTLAIENSVTYGTDGMLVVTLGELKPITLNFDVIDDDGYVYGSGKLNILPRVTQ